jgi:putative peptidoglycan lipid II flippase
MQNPSLLTSTKQTLLTICLTSGLLIGFFIRDILLARKLGVGEELDSFQFASFFPLLITSMLAVPLGPTLLNFFIILKQDSSKKIVSSWLSAVSACFLTLFIFLGILSFILTIGLSKYSEDKINIIYLVPWFAAVVVFSTSVVISNAVLYANNSSVKANVAALVVPIVSILLIQLFGSQFGAIVAAIGLFIGQLINLWIVAKECNLLGYSIYPKFGETYWRKWLPQYLPFIASTSMISLTIPIGIFFASQLPLGSIGVFSLGAKISQSFNIMISLTLSSIALPYFSKKFSQDKITEASHSLELALLITTVLAIPLSISIFLLANTFSYLIFFDQDISLSDLNNISSVIRLCSIQLPFFIVFATLIKFRVASKQLISVLTATAIGQTFNILLSFLLVDRYGLNGIAIAMSISMFLASMVLLIWSALDSYISLAGFAQVVISWLLLITLAICLYWKNWPGFFICIGFYILIVIYEIYPLIRLRSFNFKG